MHNCGDMRTIRDSATNTPPLPLAETTSGQLRTPFGSTNLYSISTNFGSLTQLYDRRTEAVTTVTTGQSHGRWQIIDDGMLYLAHEADLQQSGYFLPAGASQEVEVAKAPPGDMVTDMRLAGGQLYWMEAAITFDYAGPGR